MIEVNNEEQHFTHSFCLIDTSKSPVSPASRVSVFFFSPLYSRRRPPNIYNPPNPIYFLTSSTATNQPSLSHPFPSLPLPHPRHAEGHERLRSRCSQVPLRVECVWGVAGTPVLRNEKRPVLRSLAPPPSQLCMRLTRHGLGDTKLSNEVSFASKKGTRKDNAQICVLKTTSCVVPASQECFKGNFSEE